MIDMHYRCIHENDTTENIDIMIPDEDVALQTLFSHFVRLTEMMGYQAGSWEKIIDEIYGSCNLHVDTHDDYNIFDYALDTISLC